MDDWPDDEQRDNKYLGLTATQFNLAFITVIGAVALAAFVFGGVDAVREYLDDEPSSPQAVAVETSTPIDTATPTESPEEPPYVAVFERSSCRFRIPAGVKVECGFLVVPENHSKPAGRTIRLHVAIFSTESDNPAPDPIVYLSGGPGQSPLKMAQFAFDVFTPFLANRDLILLDQRGVGYSEPALDCHELLDLAYQTAQEDLPLDEIANLTTEAAGVCRDRLLRQAVSLSAYTSAQSASDLNDLRLALGYEEWNLYGVSYGTKLALTTMRDYPDGIRSVVLDSTYPLQVNLYAEVPANATRAFNVFFDSCAADAACSSAYPDLETVFFDLVQELNDTPVNVPIAVVNRFTLERIDSALIDGNRMVEMLFQSLYISEIIPLLPAMIFGVSDGDLELLGFIAEGYISGIEFSSEGMYFSVQCGEEVPFGSPEEGAAAGEVYPQVQDWVDSDPFSTICLSWGAGKADPIENEPVVSDIRTLILAGEFDPITPPAWGELVAESLSNSFYFEFPDVGHGVSRSGPCALGITLGFFDDPTIEPDGDCR